MKTNNYVIGHFGRKGTVVATMEITATSKKEAMAKYLKVYSKQTAKNCVFVDMPQAQAQDNKARKAKAQPKAESKPTKTVEPKAKPKAKASGAKAETVAVKATVVKPSKAKKVQPKAESTVNWDAEIKALKSLKGIEVSVDRDWLWVTGDTKPVKDELKAQGFRYSGKRQAWYKMPVKASKAA